MRTMRVSLAGTVILALLGGLSGAVVAQSEAADEDGTVSQVVWELPVPSHALPDDFAELVIEELTLAPGTDTNDTESLLKHEALRGRGLVIESGEVGLTPATEAMLWRGATGEAETTPAGAMVTLAVGDAIFLPKVPDDSVDREAPAVLVNPGTEAVTATSFVTLQSGDSFMGFPTGLTADWSMLGSFDPTTREALNGVDVVFRLTRTTGQPGSVIPTVAAPAFGLYLVEDGALEQVTSGPGGEFVTKWPAGWEGILASAEGLEQTLNVVGDQSATVLEYAAIPQPMPSD